MKKILIVDDDKEFLNEISDVLITSGYEITVLADGEQTISEITKIKPDVLLLDLKMGGKNGFKIADELRRLPEAKDIPVIAITGFYTEKKHRLFMQLCGIKKCLIKPFNPLDVIAAIEHAVAE